MAAETLTHLRLWKHRRARGNRVLKIVEECYLRDDMGFGCIPSRPQSPLSLVIITSKC